MPVGCADVGSENMQQLFFTVRESSKYLRMRSKQFRELVRDGRVKPAMVDDGKRLFSRGDLDALRPSLPAPHPPAPHPPPKPPAAPAPPRTDYADATVDADTIVDALPDTPEVDAVTDPMPDAPDEAPTGEAVDDPGVDPDSDWGIEVVDFDTFAFRLGSPPAGKKYRLRIRYRVDANTWPVVRTVTVDGADLFAPGTWLPNHFDGVFVVAAFPGDDIRMTTPLEPRFSVDSRPWWAIPNRYETGRARPGGLSGRRHPHDDPLEPRFSVDSRPWWAIPNRYETGRARPAETSYRGTHARSRPRDQVDSMSALD
jgi:hypothetical protein